MDTTSTLQRIVPLVLAVVFFLGGITTGAICGSKATVAFGDQANFWPWLFGALGGLLAMIVAAAIVEIAGPFEKSGATQ